MMMVNNMEIKVTPKVSAYECVFIFRSDISVQDVNKITDNLVTVLEELNAKVAVKEYWGIRNLAYQVDKNKKGHYMMLVFSANPGVILEFERNLRINEDIIKYLTVKLDSISEKPSIIMQKQAEKEQQEARVASTR